MFLEFYNLKDQPFGVTPDPAYLFLSLTHREALASLYYAIETDCGFAALIAAPGMGKTTLVFQLLERLRDSHRTAFLFQTQCDSRQFLNYLLTDLGHPPIQRDLVVMHDQLSELLLQQCQDGKRFVIVVDEAQNLDEEVLETLRLLSNFETPRQKLMQIVLAGQPQLAEKLSRRSLQQLRQRISTVARLATFSPEETRRYIEHRLKVAGYQGPPLFTEDAYMLIAEKSRGIPRLINTLCFNALSLGFSDQQTTIDGVLIKQVLADLDVSLLFPEPFSAYEIPPDSPLEKGEAASKRLQGVVPLDCPLVKGASGLSRSEGGQGDVSCQFPLGKGGQGDIPLDSPLVKGARGLSRLEGDQADVSWQEPTRQNLSSNIRSRARPRPKPRTRENLVETPFATWVQQMRDEYERVSALPPVERMSRAERAQRVAPNLLIREDNQEARPAHPPLAKGEAAPTSLQGDVPSDSPITKGARGLSRLEVGQGDIPLDSPLVKGARGLSRLEGGLRHVPDDVSGPSDKRVKVPAFLLPREPAWGSHLAGIAVGVLFFILAGGLMVHYLYVNWPSAQEEQRLNVSTQLANRRDTEIAKTGQGSQAEEVNRLPAQRPIDTPSSKGVEGGAPSPPHDSPLSVGANGDVSSQFPLNKGGEGDVSSDSPLTKGATGLSRLEGGQGDVPDQFPSLSKGGAGVVFGGPSVNGSHGDLFQPNPARQYLMIIVAPGETLHQICLHYLGRYSNKLVEEIVELNPRLKAPNHVEAGQRLRLPVTSVREMMVISGTDEPVAGRGREPRKNRP